MTAVAGIDIGATKTLVAVGAPDGRLDFLQRLDTRAAAGGDQLVERAAAALAGQLDGVAALGAGVGGPLLRAQGVLVDPPHLGWRDYPLAERLAARTGLRVVVDNDCNVGALGEHSAGAGRGASSLVYFGVGTGIGGGVIVGGRLHRGASDNAGELGHLIVDMRCDGDPASWHGSVESLACGRGLAAQARRAAADGRAAALLARAGSAEAITAADVAALAAQGDEAASAIWRRGIAALGAAVASMLNALSPDVVVLGGGIAVRGGSAYVDAVAAEARRRAFGPNATASRIVAAGLAERSVIVGALALAAQR